MNEHFREGLGDALGGLEKEAGIKRVLRLMASAQKKGYQSAGATLKKNPQLGSALQRARVKVAASAARRGSRARAGRSTSSRARRARRWRR